MRNNGRGTPPRIGEYDYGNGRRGRHPIRRRTLAGPPAWVRQPVVEPVVGAAREDEVVLRDGKPALRGNFGSDDALYGERDRSIEQEMADLEVWE